MVAAVRRECLFAVHLLCLQVILPWGWASGTFEKDASLSACCRRGGFHFNLGWCGWLFPFTQGSLELALLLLWRETYPPWQGRQCLWPAGVSLCTH